MALLPYLFGTELRRPRLRDQLFGLDDLLLSDILERPSNRYTRPLRNIAAIRDLGSTIKSDKEKFQVNVDVQHFAPEEISVKTVDGFIIVEGKHEEQKDEHGYVSRQFKRRYALPEECNEEAVESKLSSDGVLTVTAPKTVRGERCVPITHTGPVRRKVQDPDDEEVKADDAEVKSPQKKRRR